MRVLVRFGPVILPVALVEVLGHDSPFNGGKIDPTRGFYSVAPSGPTAVMRVYGFVERIQKGRDAVRPGRLRGQEQRRAGRGCQAVLFTPLPLPSQVGLGGGDGCPRSIRRLPLQVTMHSHRC